MASNHDERLAPVGGPIWTPTFKAVLAFVAVAMALVLVRFRFGIGAVAALNDGYSWGAWKVLNVVVLTALGSGGYAMALLVYVLNRGLYHPMVRQALLTSAVGYTSAVIALGVDIGRPWNMWRLGDLTTWNVHSVLLEIAVCVSLYVCLLWIEMAPPFLDEWRKKPDGVLKQVAVFATPKLELAYPWLIAGALVLPSMHQSSLGALFLLAGPRLHPLWQTPFLPLLFLLSCYAMGFAAVAITSLATASRWKRPVPLGMIHRLGRVLGWSLVAFLVIRLIDLLSRGALATLWPLDRFGMLFLVECGLFGTAAWALVKQNLRKHPALLWRAAGLVAAAGTLYRLSSSLLAFMPGEHWAYFPSVIEEIISLGFVGIAALGYVYIIKRYPILHAPHPPAGASAPAAVLNAAVPAASEKHPS